MKIKNRLSLYFTLISAALLLIVMGAIYFSFQRALKADFFDRLRERAKMVAALYLEADEVSPGVLGRIREKVLQKIPGEVTEIYNGKDESAFRHPSVFKWNHTVLNEVRSKEYLEFSEGRRQTVGVLYHDNQGDFVIMASATDLASERRLVLLLQIMTVIFIIVILLCFFSGRFLAQRVLSPIDRLIAQIRDITARNLHTRLDSGKENDEIGILAVNFNKLLERLEDSFTSRDTFVANVSHELRTPVTSIIGEVEVGLRQVRSAEEYRRILQSVLSDSVRLKETISALLELARIDNDSKKATFYPVRIDELLWKLQDEWNERLLPGSLVVLFSALPEDENLLKVTCNKPLLYIALNNVITNAFKFSEGNKVTCRLSATVAGLKISFHDTGIGLSAGEMSNVFEPFYRSERVSDYAGSGMGLYITNRIVSLFNGMLSIAGEEGKGAVVTIEFRHTSS